MFGKDYLFCLLGVWKVVKVVKVYVRDFVLFKDLFIEGGSNCRGWRCLEVELREVFLSCSMEGSFGFLFVLVLNLGLGSGKFVDRYLLEINYLFEDVILFSGSMRNEVLIG